jgi:hypothetical protein
MTTLIGSADSRLDASAPISCKNDARTRVLACAAMLPNLVIIGAAKCGTTSLHGYLSQHPQVSMAGGEDGGSKELRFFWREDWWDHVDWYASQFGALPVRGEATPGYTYHPHVRGVPERMHALIPDARLIYLVRDPIDRIASHWVQRYSGGDRRSFEEWMREYEKPDNLLVCASRYASQLDEYLRWFDADQILILDQHDLKHDREATLAEVFAFVGLEPVDADFSEERNAGSEKAVPGRIGGPVLERLGGDGGVARRMRAAVPRRVRERTRSALSHKVETPAIDPELRARLQDHLAPEVQRLRELTGKPFASWSF